MKHHIIVDSCCDLTNNIKENLNIKSVPLYLTLGDNQIIDDDSLNIPAFIEEMKACKENVGSAAPSPMLYQHAYELSESSFAITLSSRLSSSYSSALVAKDMLDDTKHNVHIFDSKSASAGQLLVAYKLKELIDLGKSKLEIIDHIEHFINEMKTYFVLDNIDNLLKNGRLSKIKGKLINILNIKLLMGSDGDGNIMHYNNVRGQSKIVNKMLDMIVESGKSTDGQLAVISHCNNNELANKLREKILEKFHYKDVIVVPTGGVSSLYANEKGIILAF